MAARTATKAINTQDVTDKARRELLLLLEAVCAWLSLKSSTAMLTSSTGERQEEPRH